MNSKIIKFILEILLIPLQELNSIFKITQNLALSIIMN